jgi:hypothetical protein
MENELTSVDPDRSSSSRENSIRFKKISSISLKMQRYTLTEWILYVYIYFYFIFCNPDARLYRTYLMLRLTEVMRELMLMADKDDAKISRQCPILTSQTGRSQSGTGS